MSILCLVLGFLCLVGSSSSTDSTTPNVLSTPTPTVNPTALATSANPPPTVSHSAPSVSVSSDAATPILTTPTSNSIATQPSTLTTLLPTSSGALSDATSVSVSSSPVAHVTSIKESTSGPVTTTAFESTSTKGVLLPSASSKEPEGAPPTVPSQLSDPTTVVLKSSSSATVTETTPHSLDTPSKGTPISTSTSISSESPVIKITSPSTAVPIPAITATKSEVPKIPSSSSSVPTTAAELSTRKDVNPQKTNAPNVEKLKGNIEVKCTTIENGASYVKIHIKVSSICDDNDTEPGRVEDIRSITTHICKAIKPGYQENQDKCIIHLGKINENQLAITETFIESRLQPKELYTQLKKNGANLMLFSYNGADPEDEDVVSIPLISAIVSLAVLLLIIAAAYGCWHQRKARKREQRLTEETQTMENGYHDNPTLEVMETSPEMQEKKGGPNGELGDSWIVPLDNLTREDLEEEEDTHL